MKPNRPDLDAHPNRYVWVIEVETIGNVLADEEITVVFGDTTGGSPGFQAGFHPDPDQETIRDTRPATAMVYLGASLSIP